jgi:hypothetical protein
MEKQIVDLLNSSPTFTQEFFTLCKIKKLNPSTILAQSITNCNSLFFETFIELFNLNIEISKKYFYLVKDNDIVVAITDFKNYDEGLQMFICECIKYTNNPF